MYPTLADSASASATTTRLAALVRVASLVLCASLVVAACAAGGPGEEGAPGTSPTVTPAPTLSPTVPASPTEAAGGSAINVASSAHGDHLVDAAGRALYLFTPDSPGTTTCFDECIANWPPLTAAAGGMAAGNGVSADLGSITRPDDGTLQVTVEAMPLYYFVGDAGPGDVNGQGVGGVWFLAGPDGAAVGSTPVGSPAGASPPSGPYDY